MIYTLTSYVVHSRRSPRSSVYNIMMIEHFYDTEHIRLDKINVISNKTVTRNVFIDDRGDHKHYSLTLTIAINYYAY